MAKQRIYKHKNTNERKSDIVAVNVSVDIIRRLELCLKLKELNEKLKKLRASKRELVFIQKNVDLDEYQTIQLKHLIHQVEIKIEKLKSRINNTKLKK